MPARFTVHAATWSTLVASTHIHDSFQSWIKCATKLNEPPPPFSRYNTL